MSFEQMIILEFIGFFKWGALIILFFLGLRTVGKFFLDYLLHESEEKP